MAAIRPVWAIALLWSAFALASVQASEFRGIHEAFDVSAGQEPASRSLLQDSDAQAVEESTTGVDAQAVEESTTEEAQLLVCKEKVGSEEKRTNELEEEANDCSAKIQQASFKLVTVRTAATSAAAARANATAAAATAVDAEIKAASRAAHQKQLRISSERECNANVDLAQTKGTALRHEAKFKADTRIAQLASTSGQMETTIAQEKEALMDTHRRDSLKVLSAIHEAAITDELKIHDACDVSIKTLRTEASGARTAAAAQLASEESAQESDVSSKEHDLSADELETVRKAEQARDSALEEAGGLEERVEEAKTKPMRTSAPCRLLSGRWRG